MELIYFFCVLDALLTSSLGTIALTLHLNFCLADPVILIGNKTMEWLMSYAK